MIVKRPTRFHPQFLSNSKCRHTSGCFNICKAKMPKKSGKSTLGDYSEGRQHPCGYSEVLFERPFLAKLAGVWTCFYSKKLQIVA